MQTEEERAAARQNGTAPETADQLTDAAGKEPGSAATDAAEPAVGQSAEVTQFLKQRQSGAARAAKGKPSSTSTAEGGTGVASAPATPAKAKPRKAAAKTPAAADAAITPDPQGPATPDAAAADAKKKSGEGKGGAQPSAIGPNAAGPNAAGPNAAGPNAAGPNAAGPNAKDPADANKKDAPAADGAKDAAAPATDAAAAPAGPAANGAVVATGDSATTPGGATTATTPAVDSAAAAMAPAVAPPASKGGAVDWDSEVAWHDHFQQFKGAAPAGPAAAAAPAPAPSQDRGQMVLDALKSGGKEGLKEGATAFLIETVVNVAASKIPMASSVLETGRMLVTLSQGGPKAWLEQSLTGENAIVGKWGAAYEKFKNGGVVDRIEGVVNLLEGASSFLGTLNSVLWIVAGAGFLISLACPALLPFVVLASQWALTLTKIGAVIDVFTTLLRLVVMAGRALEIMYSDASPAELLKKQESLRSQTKDFTKEGTARSLGSGREHVQEKIKAKRAAAAAPPAPAPAPAPQGGAAPKPSMSSRVLNVLGMAAGDFRPADDKGNRGLGRDMAEMKTEVGRGADVTRAAGASGGTAAKLHAMEQAGATVFINKAHEEHVDEGLQKKGKPGTVRMEERRAQERLAAATARAQQAETEANVDRQRLSAATDARRDAEQRLDAARQAQRPGITEAEAVANQRRGELVETQAEVRRTQSQLEHEREVLTMAQYCQANDRAGANTGQYDTMVATSRSNVATLEGRMTATERQVQSQRTAVQQAETQVGQRKAALAAIEADTASAGQAERAAAAKVSTSNQAQQGANAEQSRDQASLDARDRGRDDGARARWAEQQGGADSHRSLLALDGAGPTRLHGAENSAGRATIDMLDGTHKPGDKTAVGAVESLAKGIDGVGQAMSGQAAAAGGQQASPIADQVRARLAKLANELQAPPLQARSDSQMAASRLTALDQEEEDLRNKRLSVGVVRAQARTESGALKTLSGAAKAGQAATGAQAKSAQALGQKQDQHAQAIAQTSGKTGEASGKGAAAQSMLNPIVGGMLKLMGMIPSSITSKGQQGAAATQKLAGGLKDQGKASEGASSMNKTATADVGQMKQETTGAATESQTLGQELAAADQLLTAKQTETDQLGGELGEADAAGAARLKAVAAERQHMQQLQTGALARADEWVQTHAATRTKGMAEVDALAGQSGAKS